jgi:hypothetical protein
VTVLLLVLLLLFLVLSVAGFVAAFASVRGSERLRVLMAFLLLIAGLSLFAGALVVLLGGLG